MRALRTTAIATLAVGLLAGSAVGVAAQGEEAAAYFTVELGEFEGSVIDGVEVVTHPQVSAGDPRAGGALSYTGAHWTFTTPQGSVVTSQSLDARLTNEGGVWTGHGSNTLALLTDEQRAHDGNRVGLLSERTLELTGQDGYEGLTLYLRLPTMSVHPTRDERGSFVGFGWGVIVPSDWIEAPPELPPE